MMKRTLIWATALFLILSVVCGGCTRPETPTQESLSLVGSNPVTLDPALVEEVGSVQYIQEIFSGLVTFTPDLKLVPDIASDWQISPDGKTYTFHLRPEVKFHDGKKVTAADFKYSVERACDPRTSSHTALIYLGDIVGARDKLEGRAAEVSGVRVVDARTLEFAIDQPKAYFLAKLSHPCAFVVDQANVESGSGWTKKPNGTGAFKLKEWQKDRLIVLERNDLYYGQQPGLKSVEFQLWAGMPMSMYETGKVDVVPVSLSELGRVTDPANPLHNELVSVTELSVYYMGFNAAAEPFNDPKVRRAFSLAIDRDKLVKVVLKGAAQPARGILPPGIPGYNPHLQGLPFDPAQARALIAESRYGDVSRLPPITFTTASYGISPGLIVSALVDMWRQNLGVEVQVNILEPEIYYYHLKEAKDQLFDSGWVADYPDPENFLDILFHTGSQQNNGEYSNPQVDILLEQARAELQEEKRTALYQEAERLLIEDAACLPMFHNVEYMLVKPYVEGFVLSPMPLPYLKYISIRASSAIPRGR